MVPHPLVFNLKVSLGLKWVSCKQHIDGNCFLTHSVTVCLLIGALSTLTFRVSTERYEFIAIIMLVELEFLVIFSGPFLLAFFFSPLTSIYLFRESACACAREQGRDRGRIPSRLRTAWSPQQDSISQTVES